jgi:CRISPR-associated endoribonuclease Cas6
MPYAFLLALIPFAQEASPLHFSLHTHGLFFALLGKIDPQKTTEIHQAKREPFTLIPLPDKHALRLRVTTLDNALFAPFGAPCGLSLGDPPYMLT